MNIFLIVSSLDVMRLFINTYPLIYLAYNIKLEMVIDDFIKSYPLIYLNFKGKSNNDMDD